MTKKKPLKLHSSLPEGYQHWAAKISMGPQKPLTREMFVEFFERIGGKICGRCEKRMTDDEGKYLVTNPSMWMPGVGDVDLGPHISQYKYCPRCHEALENEGKPKLEVVVDDELPER